MLMQRSNLIKALGQAIHAQEEVEAALKYDRPSAYLQGLQDVFDALIRGDHVDIVGEPD